MARLRKLEEPRIVVEATGGYEDALLEWHSKRSTEESAKRQEDTRLKDAYREFDRRADKLRERYEDFDDVVNAPVFTETMRKVLLHGENGPQLAYYLGRPEHRKIAERISTLPADIQPYEIGKLESQLIIAAKTKKVSAAPEPIKPVGGPAAPVLDESKMSDEEWFKREQQKRLDRLKEKWSGG